MSVRVVAFVVAMSLPAEVGAQQGRPATPTTLVDVRSADRTIRIAAPTSILVGADVAERLGRVAHRLATGAVGLKVFSGYQSAPGVHADGMAVDLTLVDLSRGTEIRMGTGYPGSDSITVPAAPGGREARYRELLRRVMTEEGFVADSARWWHYQLQPLAVSH